MKRHFVLLLALVVWGVIQMVNIRQLQAHCQVCVAGIRGDPGIQMELVDKASQVTCLLGQLGMEPGDSNRQIMREQQYLDFVFIPIYWAFFYFAIGGALRGSGAAAGRAIAKWLRLFISIAAVADYLEDAAILRALDPTYHGAILPFPFGFTKWLFFFLALAVSSLLFLRYPKLGSFPMAPSRLDSAAHWLVGLSFLVGALLGLAGTIGTFANQGSLLLLGLLPVLFGIAVLLLWFWRGSRSQAFPGPATAYH